MKKQKAIILVGAALLLLTGCASVEDEINNRLKDKLSLNEDYRLYSEYSDQLDEKGYYNGSFSVLDGTSEEELNLDRLGLNGTSEVLDQPDPHEGMVHITFAENPMFNVEYYKDPEHNNELTGGECWLSPGESVYAAEPLKTKNVTSNKFRFWEFRIWDIDSDGDYQQYASDGKDALFTIPENYSGMGYSVEPVGKYERRLLNLAAYDSENDSVIDDVNWFVNGEAYNSVDGISPTEAYSVSCEFRIGNNNYYVESTEPAVDSSSITSDRVNFSKEQPGNSCDSYTVKLHRYISGKIIGDTNGIKDSSGNITLKCKRRGESEWKDISPNKDNVIPELQVGDQLLISVKKGFKMQCVPFEVNQPKKSGENLEYTITVGNVADTAHEFLINLCGDREKDTIKHKSVSVEHGKITVKLKDYDHVIMDGDYIAPQMMVTVTMTPDEGYKIEEPYFILPILKIPVEANGDYKWETTYADFLSKLESDGINGYRITAK